MLAESLSKNCEPDEMILRYLAAYGPATLRDMCSWSGLTRLGVAVERLKPNLREFRDEAGRTLYDLPDGPLPDPEIPAPPRFLPEYDNALLSHADRSRIITRDYQERVFNRGALLLDGFVKGAWSIKKSKRGELLTIELFEHVKSRAPSELLEEAERLLHFVAGDAVDRDIQIIPG